MLSPAYVWSYLPSPPLIVWVAFGALLVELLLPAAVYYRCKKLLRCILYDWTIIYMTERWYKAALDRMPDGANVLDVGIGTGSALLRHLDLLREMDVVYYGIDFDFDYVERCRSLISHYDAGDVVDVQCLSFYDYQPKASAAAFDVIYFSASLMLMPDPVAALAHARSMLADDGQIIITQNFELEYSPRMELLKHLGRTLTGVDYGKTSYLDDLIDYLPSAELNMVEYYPVPNRHPATFGTPYVVILEKQ